MAAIFSFLMLSRAIVIKRSASVVALPFASLMIASFADALNAAKKAKDEIADLKSDNEKILAQARAERDMMLKEARDAKDAIINEAKGKATTEAERLIAIARESIKNEKMAAITELKNQVATLSVEIAEKIMKQQLANDDKQKSLIADLLKDAKLN